MLDKMTNQLKETLDSAASLAMHAKNQEITTSHLIWAMLLDSQSILNQALNKMNAERAELELAAKSAVERLPKVSSIEKEGMRIDKELSNALENALGFATQNGDSYIALDSFIIANIKADAFKKRFCG